MADQQNVKNHAFDGFLIPPCNHGLADLGVIIEDAPVCDLRDANGQQSLGMWL
jgi:hypothetical protein